MQVTAPSIRAQNSKKNNYNQAKIDRHVAYIDNKLEEYTSPWQRAMEMVRNEKG